MSTIGGVGGKGKQVVIKSAVFVAAKAKVLTYACAMANNEQPNLDDLDGLADVPTYQPEHKKSGSDKLYERYGRPAPQNIAATKPEQEAEPKMATPEPTQNLYKISSAPEPTASFDAPTTDKPLYQSPFSNNSVADDPYVAPAETAESTPVTNEVDARRGTIDFGLMIIRVVIGALLLLMGLRTFFELGGAPGITGLQSQFSDYALGGILAIAVPTLQLIAGVFLLLGLLTPVAASIATAVTGFGAVHALAQADGINVFYPETSLTLSALLAAIALGLQFTGPGKLSFDVARSWARRPLASSWIWAIVGIAGAVALWWFGAGVNPLN